MRGSRSRLVFVPLVRGAQGVACPHTCGVVETMQVVTTVCAIAAGVGAVLLIVARLLAGHWPLAARWGAAVASARPVLTLIVAAARGEGDDGDGEDPNEARWP